MLRQDPMSCTLRGYLVLDFVDSGVSGGDWSESGTIEWRDWMCLLTHGGGGAVHAAAAVRRELELRDGQLEKRLLAHPSEIQ